MSTVVVRHCVIFTIMTFFLTSSQQVPGLTSQGARGLSVRSLNILSVRQVHSLPRFEDMGGDGGGVGWTGGPKVTVDVNMSAGDSSKVYHDSCLTAAICSSPPPPPQSGMGFLN